MDKNCPEESWSRPRPGLGWPGAGWGEEPEDARSPVRLPAKKATAQERFQDQAKIWGAEQGN